MNIYEGKMSTPFMSQQHRDSDRDCSTERMGIPNWCKILVIGSWFPRISCKRRNCSVSSEENHAVSVSRSVSLVVVLGI